MDVLKKIFFTINLVNTGIFCITLLYYKDYWCYSLSIMILTISIYLFLTSFFSSHRSLPYIINNHNNNWISIIIKAHIFAEQNKKHMVTILLPYKYDLSVEYKNYIVCNAPISHELLTVLVNGSRDNIVFYINSGGYIKYIRLSEPQAINSDKLFIAMISMNPYSHLFTLKNNNEEYADISASQMINVINNIFKTF